MRNKRKQTTRKSLAQVLGKNLAIGACLSAAACLVIFEGFRIYMRGAQHEIAAQTVPSCIGRAESISTGEDQGYTFDTAASSIMGYAFLDNGIQGEFGAVIYNRETGERLGDSFNICVRLIPDEGQPFGEILSCDSSQPDIMMLEEKRAEAEAKLDQYYVDQGTAWADIEFTKLYVNKEERTFLPAEAVITCMENLSGVDQRERTLETYSFEPEGTEGMELVEGTAHTYSWCGTPKDQGLLDRLNEGYDGLVSGYRFEWGMNGGFKRTYISDFNVTLKGVPCTVVMGMLYDGWTAYWQRWMTVAWVSACVVIIGIAAVCGLLRYQKMKAAWEMEDYRRRTTDALAHDLKTPLTAMIGYAENLRESQEPQVREKYIDGIISNAAYSNDILTSYLELSKAEQLRPGKREKLELVGLAESLAGKYSPALEDRGIGLEHSGSVTAFCEAESISRAVENLISNAVKYTPDGGKIVICAEGGCLVIRNTVAKAIEDVSRLTEPFYKPDSSRTGRNGSGLGLAIAKQLIENQGFSLELGCTDTEFTARIKV